MFPKNNAPESVWSGRVARWLVPAALLALGFCLIPLLQTCGLKCFPGDLGDARFNDVVLEHFYRWMTGQQRSLISPSYFYPMPGALTFSDNHWGSAWIYSIFRMIGADRYQAFDLWYLSAFIANFVATNYVFRRLGFSVVASAVGAFAFTFAMPVVAKYGHAQLVWRALIPLALLCWQRFRETSAVRWVGRLAITVALQFFVSIYLGYFLLLFIAAWAVCQWLIEGWGPRKWLEPWLQWRAAGGRKELVTAGVTILLALIAVAWLMAPYLHFAHLYGFRRSRDEIASMLPRPQSYLIADLSNIWRTFSYWVGSTIPMRAEQQMFFGAGAIGLAVLGIIRSPSRMRWIAALSFMVLVVLTLSVGGHSLYLWLVRVPGVDSIRAVARIGLVLTLPLALLIAMAIDTARDSGGAVRILAVALVVVMICESSTISVRTVEITSARDRITRLAAQVPDDLPPRTVLFNPLRADEYFYVSELDGVILAQETGRPTLNGYSGNIPPGYEPRSELSPCAQVLARMRGSADFFIGRLKRPRPRGAENMPFVFGAPAGCDEEVMREPSDAELGKISMRVETLGRGSGGILVRVRVHNGSEHAVSTLDGARHPLRLSWQTLSNDAASDPSAWVPRIVIPGADPMMPGEDRVARFVVPESAVPASRVAISAVLEGRAWLHDHGAAPVIASLSAGI